MPDTMRVLIIKTSAMGDIIHALQVPDYLHKVCPGIEIDWVVEEQFKDILVGNPLLRRLHIIRTKQWRKDFFSAGILHEISSVISELRKNQYDMVFDIQGNLKSGIIARLSRSKKRIGFSRAFLQEKINALFTNVKVHPRDTDTNALSHYLEVFSAIFGKEYSEMDLTADIYTDPEHDDVASQLITECGSRQVFLFHGGTTWQTKFWSEEGWIELGKAIHAKFPDSMILLSWGNDSEKASAERVASGIGGKAHVLDRFSLKGIAAVIKKVDVVVGGDTGLTHLAAAVGTPTVSYYRASNGCVSGPRGPKHVIVQSPMPCTRCFQTSCTRDSECRNSISPKCILDGISALQPYFKLPNYRNSASGKVSE
jgi:heptosyltransferase I